MKKLARHPRGADPPLWTHGECLHAGIRSRSAGTRIPSPAAVRIDKRSARAPPPSDAEDLVGVLHSALTRFRAWSSHMLGHGQDTRGTIRRDRAAIAARAVPEPPLRNALRFRYFDSKT